MKFRVHFEICLIIVPGGCVTLFSVILRKSTRERCGFTSLCVCERQLAHHPDWVDLYLLFDLYKKKTEPISSITLHVYVASFQFLSIICNHDYQVKAPDLRSHVFWGSLTFKLQEGAINSICVQHNLNKECVRNRAFVHWASSIWQKNAC